MIIAAIVSVGLGMCIAMVGGDALGEWLADKYWK